MNTRIYRFVIRYFMPVTILFILAVLAYFYLSFHGLLIPSYNQ